MQFRPEFELRFTDFISYCDNNDAKCTSSLEEKLFSPCYLNLTVVFWLLLGDPLVSQNPWELYGFHFIERILVCVNTIWQYGQIYYIVYQMH